MSFDPVWFLPWVLFGGFVASIFASDGPRWFKRLPSDAARFSVCVGIVVFFPLLLVAGIGALAVFIPYTLVHGVIDIVYHVRPKDRLPRARVTRERT